ncbi:Cdc7p-Dbf4p kinase complex regulatory subunit [Sorochytrium milnesiophthora]
MTAPSAKSHRLPLSGCVFYLCLERHTDQQKEVYIDTIADLGGAVEGFYSNKISHLVLEELPDAAKETDGTPEQRHEFKQCLRQYTARASGQSTAPTAAGTHVASSKWSKARQPPKDFCFLTDAFFLLADASGSHRPIVLKQYTPDEEVMYPRFQHNTIKSHPPFGPVEPTHVDDHAPTFELAPTTTFSIASIPASNVPDCGYLDARSQSSKKKKRRQEPGEVQRPTFQDEFRKMHDSLLLRNRAERNARAHPKAGYCEHCSEKFESLTEHMASLRHCKIVGSGRYWTKVDALVERYRRTLSTVVDNDGFGSAHWERTASRKTNAHKLQRSPADAPSQPAHPAISVPFELAVSLSNSSSNAHGTPVEIVPPPTGDVAAVAEPAGFPQASQHDDGADLGTTSADDAVVEEERDDLVDETEIDDAVPPPVRVEGPYSPSPLPRDTPRPVLVEGAGSQPSDRPATSALKPIPHEHAPPSRIPFFSVMSDSADVLSDSLFDTMLTEDAMLAQPSAVAVAAAAEGDADVTEADIPTETDLEPTVQRLHLPPPPPRPAFFAQRPRFSAVMVSTALPSVSSFVSPRLSPPRNSRSNNENTDDLGQYKVELPSLSSVLPTQSQQDGAEDSEQEYSRIDEIDVASNANDPTHSDSPSSRATTIALPAQHSSPRCTVYCGLRCLDHRHASHNVREADMPDSANVNNLFAPVTTKTTGTALPPAPTIPLQRTPVLPAVPDIIPSKATPFTVHGRAGTPIHNTIAVAVDLCDTVKRDRQQCPQAERIHASQCLYHDHVYNDLLSSSGLTPRGAGGEDGNGGQSPSSIPHRRRQQQHLSEQGPASDCESESESDLESETELDTEPDVEHMPEQVPETEHALDLEQPKQEEERRDQRQDLTEEQQTLDCQEGLEPDPNRCVVQQDDAAIAQDRPIELDRQPQEPEQQASILEQPAPAALASPPTPQPALVPPHSRAPGPASEPAAAPLPTMPDEILPKSPQMECPQPATPEPSPLCSDLSDLSSLSVIDDDDSPLAHKSTAEATKTPPSPPFVASSSPVPRMHSAQRKRKAINEDCVSPPQPKTRRTGKQTSKTRRKKW